MELPKRMSLNTSMKNAKIFTDDSDDEDAIFSFQELMKQRIRQEPTQEIESPVKVKQEIESPVKVKQEIESPVKVKQEIEWPVKVKQEKLEADHERPITPPAPTISSKDIKLTDDYKRQIIPPAPAISSMDIKMNLEPEYNSSDNCDIAMERLGLQTPIKTEEDGYGKSSLKSAKRTLLKQRNSPYTKASPTSSRSESQHGEEKRGKKKKWEFSNGDEDERHDNTKVRKRTNSERKLETDPVVLARRQKQIDFGKNTLGYENYIAQVPKDKRSADDPATPNKYRVYSRRGFDGLIKQWRLKLHKYDP